jgi:hypothetical protein
MADMTLVRSFPERHIPAQGRVLSSSGIVPPLNKLIALPFDAGGTFAQIGALIKYGGSGDSVMRAGIYDRDANGLPGSLIYDAGEFSTDNAHQGPLDMPLDEPRYFDTPFWVVALFGGETAPNMLGSGAISAIEMQHVFGLSPAHVQAGFFTGSNAVTADYPYDALPAAFPETMTLSASALWLTVKT